MPFGVNVPQFLDDARLAVLLDDDDSPRMWLVAAAQSPESVK